MSVNPGVKGTFPLDESLPVDPTQPYDKLTNPAEYWGAYVMERTNQVPGSFYELFPGYASMRHGGRPQAAIDFVGKIWYDFRKMFVALFDSVMKSPSTRRFVKEIMMRNAGKYIPVRTGHLYDAIFRSLYFNNEHPFSSRHLVKMWFRWPLDRPMPIKGMVAHTFPATGYGDQWGIIGMPVKYQAPNVNPIAYGPRGGVIYGLNDPSAMSDPTPMIIQEGIKQMQDMFRDVYQGLRIKMVVNNPNIHVKVSGGGQDVELLPTAF